MKLDFDVAILGAGVAGMTAAIYLKRAGLSCCLIEKSMYGGQVNLSPEIRNYPGFLKINGVELSQNIFSQIEDLQIPFINQEAIGIKNHSQYKEIALTDKKILVKALIIATGRVPKKIGVDRAEELVGRGISYCATCDGPLYKGKDVLVVGGGSSAMEEALFLSELCHKVTILNRSNEMRAEEYYRDRVAQKKNIQILFNTTIEEFVMDQDHLVGVIIKNPEGHERISAEGCFICIGYEPATILFSSFLETDFEGYIKVDAGCRTSAFGVYAAGDLVKKEKFQIITAMNDGILAAHSCIKDLEK